MEYHVVFFFKRGMVLDCAVCRCVLLGCLTSIESLDEKGNVASFD
jgi:hypothetical protein